MKQLLYSVGFVCLIVMPLLVCAPAPEPEAVPEAVFDQAAEEAAIREVGEQFLTAFNNHDAKAYTSLVDENFENWEGDLKGRAAFEKMLTESFERQKSIKAKALDDIGIVFATPNVAIWKGRAEFVGRLDADGKPLPPLRMLVAQVLVKKNSNWLRAARFSRPIER